MPQTILLETEQNSSFPKLRERDVLERFIFVLMLIINYIYTLLFSPSPRRGGHLPQGRTSADCKLVEQKKNSGSSYNLHYNHSPLKLGEMPTGREVLETLKGKNVRHPSSLDYPGS
jgi:hypothetical protein